MDLHLEGVEQRMCTAKPYYVSSYGVYLDTACPQLQYFINFTTTFNKFNQTIHVPLRTSQARDSRARNYPYQRCYIEPYPVRYHTGIIASESFDRDARHTQFLGRRMTTIRCAQLTRVVNAIRASEVRLRDPEPNPYIFDAV